MTIKHYVSAFVLALLLVPAAAFVAQAETTDPTTAELKTMIEALTTRVVTLEKDLDAAEAKIAVLESRIGKSGKIATTTLNRDGKSGKWSGDKYEKGDKKICHMGQTLEVSGWAAAAHMIHHPGDTLGECNEGEDADDDDSEDKDDDGDDDDESEGDDD